MIVVVLVVLRMRKGEELKVPQHASAAAIRDNHVTTRDIVPTLATLLLWLPSIYIYHLVSVTNINPPYLLLLLQYKSRCPKICQRNSG
jgi:hypothetical protein